MGLKIIIVIRLNPAANSLYKQIFCKNYSVTNTYRWCVHLASGQISIHMLKKKFIFIQAWTDEIKHCYQMKKKYKPGQFSQAAMAAMCTCKEKGSFV